MSYKYGTFFPLIVSLWSILALSGTLASEARRGSLEFVAAAPIYAPRIALEKLGGHLVALGDRRGHGLRRVARSPVRRRSPAGRRDPGARRLPGMRCGCGRSALVAGALAFALARSSDGVRRSASPGRSMFAGFILNGYRTAIPEVAPFADLTWFGWTASHIPLAGQFDWASVGLVLGRGHRLPGHRRRWRSSAATSGRRVPIPSPSLPRALVGLHGPTGRTFGAQLPSALAWGLGIGLFGLIDRGIRAVVRRPAGRVAGLPRACSRASSRTATSRRSVASSSSCSSSSDTCWPGWRRRPSSPCGPRTRPPVDSSSCSRRRCRAGAGSSPAGSPCWPGSSWSR